jgi:mycothiol synthase
VSRVEISRVNRGWVIRSRDHLTTREFDDAIGLIARNGGGTVRWFVCQTDAVEQGIVSSHGFTSDAPLLHMRCTLPLDDAHRLPTGFTARAFRPGIDDDEWLAVNARAFAQHPEQGDWTPEVLHERMAEPWFDPNGFLVHEIDGRIAGFCWTKVHQPERDHSRDDSATRDPHTPLDEPVGEIYVIGVDPSHHGKGLGRALTVAGFAHLASLGIRHGMLYVAGDNAAAIALYQSLGMSVAHQDDVFVGTVAAAH